MTVQQRGEGLAQAAEDGGMQCERDQWDEWLAYRAFLPHLYGSPDTIGRIQQDRAGQVRNLKRAPKRRAGPSW
eukprot:953011-Pyramimonas_sp.AAC.1